MEAVLRKIVAQVEEVFIEGGKAGQKPVKAVTVAAVLTNPWAGRGFVEDLRPEILALAPKLGEAMVARLTALIPPEAVEAYGKGAMVGTAGEIEHGSALIHTLRFGNYFRNAVLGSTYLSFTNTRGGPGATLSVPMTHKSEVGKRSHFLTGTLAIQDAPAPDEILIAIAASDGGRLHPRIGDRFLDMKEMEAEARS